MVDDPDIDGAGAYGGRHLQVKDEDRDDVAHRRHRDRMVRLEHAGGHHRGDRVGRVVKAVHEVEQQRERHQQGDHPQAHLNGLHADCRLRRFPGRCLR
ncbi:hypothetical protein D9M71_798640 [compost metagenome]